MVAASRGVQLAGAITRSVVLAGAVGAIAVGALALGASACDGKIVEPLGASATDTPRFPRLSHVQWENTVTDLFDLAQPPGLAQSFDADPPLGRFDNNVARLQVTAGLWQDYQRAAEQVAEIAVADPVAMARIVPSDLPDPTADPGAAARAFITSFGLRAFRRPLTDPEVARYAALFPQGSEHFAGADPFADGVRITIEAMLQSPNFLYRVELSTSSGGSGGQIPLTDYEVASRLSYLFWNTMPDDALLEAAASGELGTEAGVRAHALRLMDDPRARAAIDHFHEQLFETREWGDLDKDPGLFPEWRREIGAMMETEALLFLSSVIFDKDGSIGDFLTATHTFVNADLAGFYGLDGAFDDQFVEVELDPQTRSGFLTRLGFLTRNATLTEPDPIHRGVFTNLNVICRPINALPNLPDNLMPVGDTNRERITSITGDGTCGAGCHSTIINPIGFAFENYDAIGRFRTEDNGNPVDATGTYVFEDGRSLMFDDAIGLSRQLAETPDVHTCYLSSLLEYMFGAAPGASDAFLVSELTQASVGEQASIRELIARVVTSPAFRFRPAGQ